MYISSPPHYPTELYQEEVEKERKFEVVAEEIRSPPS